MKNGWKPLAPALQSALDTAMAMSVDRVEVLIDPVSRTWYMDVASADDEVRQRCTWYVVFPRRQEMGKIDGAPPRSVRWAPEERSPVTLAPSERRMPNSHEEREDGADRSDVQEDLSGDTEGDPLMFTAICGFIIDSAMFERLQQNVQARHAAHRYASVLLEMHEIEACHAGEIHADRKSVV